MEKFEKLFSLGELYISDFIEKDSEPRHEPVEMTLMYNNGLVRLEKSANPEYMYGKYWYRSGINSTMSKELKSIVESILSVKNVSTIHTWLDIACNDGTLLGNVPESIYRVGIDPVEDSYVAESKRRSDYIVQDFFSKESFYKSGSGKASVITAIAMFYDLENPDIFLQDVREILTDDGLFVVQMSYTPLMLEQMAFDNICHEHIYYYNLTNITELFNKNGFKIVDCQLNDINGGSFRVYAIKDTSNVNIFSTSPNRDVCQFRINSLLEFEKNNKYNTKEIWYEFYDKLLKLRDEVYNFIVQEKQKGKSIWCYGASTKGNTLLQYFGLDCNLIDGIAERSPYKFGLKTVGTNIPIYREEEMRKVNPDYLLILPWHFIDEFCNRENNYLKNGGKFIVPCPNFCVVEK